MNNAPRIILGVRIDEKGLILFKSIAAWFILTLCFFLYESPLIRTKLTHIRVAVEGKIKGQAFYDERAKTLCAKLDPLQRAAYVVCRPPEEQDPRR